MALDRSEYARVAPAPRRGRGLKLLRNGISQAVAFVAPAPRRGRGLKHGLLRRLL